MFLLGPVLVLLLLRDRVGAAGALAALGVLAKEFAAAPLWIVAGAWWFSKRRAMMLRVGVMALGVTAAWMVVQLILFVAYGYSYDGNPSSKILAGGYLAYWLNKLGVRVALSALGTEFGALYLLVPMGLLFAGPRLRHLAIATIPAALAFGYVQQPDRALWNFHFLATPLAAIVLAKLPIMPAATFVAAYGAANLRVGAQLASVPRARFGLLVSIVLALIALIVAWRTRADRDEALAKVLPADVPMTTREGRRVVWAAAATWAVLLAGALVLVDLSAHWRTEEEYGLNMRGYRGPVAVTKRPDDVRIALLGGDLVYGTGVRWPQSVAVLLQRYLQRLWQPGVPDVPLTVVNLAAPPDPASSFVMTLKAYDYLAPDIVVLIAGHNDINPDAARPVGGWRQGSVVFRRTGYLPILPALLTGRGANQAFTPGLLESHLSERDDQFDVHATDASGFLAPIGTEPTVGTALCIEPWTTYCNGMASAVEHSLARGRKVVVASEPYLAPRHIEQEHALATMIARRFGRDERVRYLDLGTLIDLRDRTMSPDGVRLTPLGNERLVEALTDPVLEIVRER